MHNVNAAISERNRMRTMADNCHKHARDCRKPLADCYVCRFNIAWFDALPLKVLSDVLTEPNQREK